MRKPSSTGTSEHDEFKNAQCELQMTPMIDVTFLLLIFFMCTLKFKVLEGAMGAHLPKDVGVNIRDAEPVEKIVVRMDVVEPGTRMRPMRNGGLRPYTLEDAANELRFEYGSDRVIRYRVGARSGMDQSAAFEALRKLVEGNPEARCSIDPRSGVIQDEVVQVLDAFLAAGVKDVTFIGSYED
jgi:biopolymer transport protein ExbD